MDRKYSTDSSRRVMFFIGNEIERTKFYNMKTLFVVGLQRLEKIIELADEHSITHIFLGANHSCYDQITAQELLNKGFKVTIDCWSTVAKFVNIVDASHPNFCLLIRYELDEQHMNENTYIKFYSNKADRKGIYVIPSVLLQNEEHYTDNSEYGNDIIISEE